jgi:hypothetical protein
MLKTLDKKDFELSQETVANSRNPRKRVDIEELVRWTYQDQRADEVTRRAERMVFPSEGRSNLVSLEQTALLGIRIDCAGSIANSNNEINPDAETVHDTVRKLSPIQIGLIIQHAKAGDRPEWFEGEEPRPVALLYRGRPVMEYADPKTCRKPLYCFVDYEPDIDHVAFVREMYAAWWAALADLALLINDMTSYEIVGPNAPEKPWLKNPVDSRGKT